MAIPVEVDNIQNVPLQNIPLADIDQFEIDDLVLPPNPDLEGKFLSAFIGLFTTASP